MKATASSTEKTQRWDIVSSLETQENADTDVTNTETKYQSNSAGQVAFLENMDR